MKNSLFDLINEYGEPDALIDNHSESVGYAIWGFDEVVYQINDSTYHNHQKVRCNSFELLHKLINKWSTDINTIKSVGFMSYDIKNIIYPHIQFKKLKSNFPFFWFAKPSMIKPYSIQSNRFKEDSFKFLSKIKGLDSLSNYSKIINKIKKELFQGNSYQINYTMEQKYKIDLNSIDVYLLMRQIAKPQYGYFLKIKDYDILSFSPESFFHTEKNKIFTYPMKGTINKGKNKQENDELKNKLMQSSKDRAEHIMIVDLLRNDLGKICEFGSVKTKDLFSVQSFTTINQMVSCIYGNLKNGVSFIDIIKALCPGGAITGAPKESSMKIIDLLESYNREIYTGAIGHIDINNDFKFNIAIRTMLIKDQIAKYCVGGGIVWDSQEEEELHEAQLKSNILNEFIK